jgi:hypothetical protein
VFVLAGAGHDPERLVGDVPGQGAAELAGSQLPGRLAVAVAGDERLTARRCQQVVDVGGEAVEAGQHVGVHPVLADAGLGEQVGGVVVDGEQHADGLVDDVQDDPFFAVPGEPAVFEDPAAQLVAGAAVRAGLGEGAIAGELADYWWRGVIRSVRYSLLRKRRAAAAVSSILWWSRDDRELVTLQTAATRPSSHAESSASSRRA